MLYGKETWFVWQHKNRILYLIRHQ
jgi:hypothetical protein